ncbi:hypothetical protein OpiT1DRAFT_04308 [Opitutaceae bacterium TAV1]|nr:hypothetical protein OpiT1DRAFT_04308 [Opitutaceae bacterium TAV1]
MKTSSLASPDSPAAPALAPRRFALVWHIVKKDLRQQRRLLLVWGGVWLLRLAFPLWLMARLEPSEDIEHGYGTTEATVLPIVLLADLLLLFVIIARAVQSDGPLRKEAFWRTQPVSPGQMLTAKLLFAGIACWLAPLVVMAAALLCYGAGAEEFFVSLRSVALNQAACVLAASTFAVVFRGVAASLIIAALVSCLFIILLPGANPAGLDGVLMERSLFASRMLAGAGVLLASAVIAWRGAWIRRSEWRAWFAGTLGFILALSAARFWPVDFVRRLPGEQRAVFAPGNETGTGTPPFMVSRSGVAGKPAVSSSPYGFRFVQFPDVALRKLVNGDDKDVTEAEKISRRGRYRAWREEALHDLPRIQPAVTLRAAAPHEDLVWEPVRLEVNASGRQTWETTAALNWRPDNLAIVYGLLRKRGVAPLGTGYESPVCEWLFPLSGFFSRTENPWPPPPFAWEGKLEYRVGRPEIVCELPLRAGAKARGPGIEVKVLRTKISYGSIFLTVRERRPASAGIGLPWIDRLFEPESWFDGVRYVLVNDRLGEATTVDPVTSRESLAEFMQTVPFVISSRRMDFTVVRKPEVPGTDDREARLERWRGRWRWVREGHIDHEQQRAAEEAAARAWLADARLLVIRVAPAGRATAEIREEMFRYEP